jgi:hypothetical protein
MEKQAVETKQITGIVPVAYFIDFQLIHILSKGFTRDTGTIHSLFSKPEKGTFIERVANERFRKTINARLVSQFMLIFDTRVGEKIKLITENNPCRPLVQDKFGWLGPREYNGSGTTAEKQDNEKTSRIKIFHIMWDDFIQSLKYLTLMQPD